MNRSTAAFLIAFLFHLLLVVILFLFAENFKIIKNNSSHENRMKISLKELPKTQKKDEVGVKKVIQKPETIPPTHNPLLPKPLQKYVAKPTEQSFHQTNINKSEPVQQKSTPIVPTISENKSYIAAPKVVNTANKSTTQQVPKEHAKLYKFLSQEDHSQQNQSNDDKSSTQRGSQLDQNLKELYGAKFGQLSQGEQKYIEDNTETMRRITQEILNRVGRVNIPDDLRVNSTNVIEFYLHPNGDMTDFKFLKNSNYYILDDTTKETIEYAYSKYPRPQQKTLIRYKVYYNLRGN